MALNMKLLGPKKGEEEVFAIEALVFSTQIALQKAKYPDLIDDMGMQDLADGLPWMADRIEELEAKLAWQPIETAPRSDSGSFLASDDIWVGVGYFVWDSFRLNHYAVSQEYNWTPTHWMPLPALPSQN